MSIKKNKDIEAGRNVTVFGIWVNIGLFVLKIVCGIIGQSQALIADAVHSISDFFTDLVVLVGLKIGGKGPDQDHHYGHGRVETMASAVVGLTLIIVAAGLGYDAVKRLFEGTAAQPKTIALVAAAVSILSKEILYRYTVRVGRRIKSTVIQANAWHHRSDALSSIAVLLGVGAAKVRPEWYYFDSIAAILVSLLVLKVGADVIRECLKEFTDASPHPEIINRIVECAADVEGVRGIHDLKVRTVGGLYQMELHVVVDGQLKVTEGHRIAKKVEACLLESFDETDLVTIHVDPDEDDHANHQHLGDGA